VGRRTNSRTAKKRWKWLPLREKKGAGVVCPLTEKTNCREFGKKEKVELEKKCWGPVKGVGGGYTTLNGICVVLHGCWGGGDPGAKRAKETARNRLAIS